MRKRPFLVFMAVIGILVAGVIGFIQSAQFATLLKRAIVRYLPADLGVDGDFSELSIRLFPPALSIRSPQLAVRKRNFMDLPAGSRIHAARMDFLFLPFQMLSGNIRVNQVRVVDGEVTLAFAPDRDPKASKRALGLRWDELLQIRADSFALERTHVKLSWPKSGIVAEFLANDASVGQWSQGKKIGYELKIALEKIHGKFPADWDVPTSGIESLDAHAIVTEEGVTIERISAKANGTKLNGTGAISGDVLNPKGLGFEGEVSVIGTMPSLLAVAGNKSKEAQGAKGEVVFKGNVRMALDRPAQTLRAEGSLAVSGFRFGPWDADRIEADGAWSPAGSGGEVSLNRAIITSPELKREGGHRPGGGGRIEIGAFRYRLGSRDAIEIPVKLERAHLHWLSAPILKSVYGLDLRATGGINLVVQPKLANRAWNVDAGLDLKVTGFQLDNQRMGQTKPLKRIVVVPEIRVVGPTSIDAAAFRARGISLSAGKSKFQANGKVDFTTGWDMRFDGEAHMEDVGQIAENEVRGQGRIMAHVHGPGSRTIADFDTDVKEAYYLRMQLGHLKGRITWDDDPSHLIFKGMDIVQGRTRYQGEGVIDLGSADSVAMGVRFLPGGRMEDLNRIFSDFTKELWWFPSSMTGEMSGNLAVSGGLALDQLVVRGGLAGPDWEILGERFMRSEINGGYDKGKYVVESFRASKPSGRVSAKISYAPDDTIDWQLQTEDFVISDFDHVARLDVPIRGRLRLTSRGSGPLGTVDSESHISLWDVAVRGASFPRSEATLTSSKGMAELKSNGFGGQATLEAQYGFKPGSDNRLRGELRKLDFSPVLLLLNPKMIQDRSLVGTISGQMDLRFKTGEADRLSGSMSLSGYELAKTGTRFSLVEPVAVRIDRGTFDLDRLAIRGPRGEAVLRARSREARLEGALTGEVDASLAEFFTPVVVQAAGRGALDFRLGGELSAPVLAGRGILSGGTVRIAALESPFDNVAARVLIAKNVIEIEKLDADLANGRVNGGGKIELFVDRYPKVALDGQINGSRLRIFPFQFVKLRGKIGVHGEEIPYRVSGDIVIEQGISREKVMNQNQGRSLKSARYTPPPTARRVSDYPKFRLDIDVRADQGLLVQNDLFDVELKALVKVVNTLETPRIVGTADVIQGKMIFKDRAFAIQSASAKFDNPAVINPLFNMTATTDVGGNKIQMYAAGRMDSFKVDLSSNPVLPESEILSLLALGATSDDMRKLKGGDRSAYEQGEAASLVLHSLDFNREIQNRTGFQLELDEAVNGAQTGSSVFRPRSDGDSAVAPKIVIKRRLGKKATVSVGSTVGVGTSNQKEVNLEYQVTPGFSVNGVWDSQLGEAKKESQHSYGVDLKLQKRFK